jgi:uncharacterized membrane protein
LWKRSGVLLGIFVVGFFAISFYSGIVAYTNLQTQNPTDAGIITQAVASTAHGHVAPFFESYDCIVKARCSFLLVHPSFVLYAAVPLYALAPSTVTLFGLRAALVAGAAIPLYALARRVTGSSGKGLIAAGLYLVWAPSFLGDAFSLHLESLLPLEMFTLALLWVEGRYRLALGVAVISFLTFDVFPIFTFLVGAFFLYPYFKTTVQSGWRRWRGGHSTRFPLRPAFAFGWRQLREGWRVREVRSLAVLMTSSIAAYLVLDLWVNVWGSAVLGLVAPSLPPGIGGLLSTNSSPAVVPLGTILSSAQTLMTAEYWLILFALVAFIPFLYPRGFILSGPWIAWTLLTNTSRFSTLGHQYSLMAAGPIFIGLAYGLQRLSFDPRPRLLPSSDPTLYPGRAGSRPVAKARRWRLPSSRTAWTTVIGIVVIGNCVLLPICPLLPALGVVPPSPFEGGYFDHSLEISPAFGSVQDLVASIPSGASVGATVQLFPLVANHPHAYVLAGSHTPEDLANLPFNISAGPQYVLTSADTLSQLQADLFRNVSNPSLYGISGYVASTPTAPVLLFEKGFAGSSERFGPGGPTPAASYVPGDGLLPGNHGVEGPDPSSPTGVVIQSLNQTDRIGIVWTGPATYLSPGNYSVVIELVVSGQNLSMSPTAHTVRIDIGGFGGTLLNETLPASAFSPGMWMNLTFSLALDQPFPSLNVEGFLVTEEASVAVASVVIEPA